MALTDDIRSTLERMVESNVGTIPKVVKGDVLKQESGLFDVSFSMQTRSGVPMVRPFGGFITGSRVDQVLLFYGGETEPVALGVIEEHFSNDPGYLRRWSWMTE